MNDDASPMDSTDEDHTVRLLHLAGARPSVPDARVQRACEPLFTINGGLAIDAEPFAGACWRRPLSSRQLLHSSSSSAAPHVSIGLRRRPIKWWRWSNGSTETRDARATWRIRARDAVSPRATGCVRVNGSRPIRVRE